MSEVVGQSHVKRFLANIVKSGRIPHAYLFCGAKGTGRTEAALSFSKALNCENVQDGEACGQCISCRKIDSGNHPDVTIIEPDGASTKIDQMRMMIREAAFRSYESPWRVFIITCAETMNQEAANSILKLLEEPPDNCVIILLSTSIRRILPTIISRCQVVEFRRVSDSVIEDYVVEKTGISKDEARPFAWLANGAPDKAVELVANNKIKALRDEIIDSISQIQDYNKLKVLQLATKLSKDKDNVDFVIDVLVTWFRDIAVFPETLSRDFLVNVDKFDLLKKSARAFSNSRVLWIINELHELKKNLWLTRRSLNVQFAFEVLLLNIVREMSHV